MNVKKRKNVSIRQTLLAGFLASSAVSLLLAGLGFYGLWNAGRTEEMQQSFLVTVPSVSDAITDISNLQSQVSHAVLESSGDTDGMICVRAQEKIAQYDRQYRASEARMEAIAPDSVWLKKIRDAKTSYEKEYMPLLNEAIYNVKNEHTEKTQQILEASLPVQEKITQTYSDYMAQLLKTSQSAVLANRSRETAFFYAAAAIAAAGIAFSVLLGFAVASGISRPLEKLAACAGEMAAGDLSTRCRYESGNEIGRLAESMNSFFGMLQGLVASVSRVLTEMAEGNCGSEPLPEFSGDFRPISEAVNRTLTDLNRVFRDVRDSAGQVADGSAQISAGSMELARGSAEQAAAAEQISSAVSGVSAAARQDTESIAGIAREMGSAAEEAESGSRQAEQMLGAMDDIAASSVEIGKIIRVIDGIAFQISILALNASVEAARAGTAGRGFSVVADEVRSLAEKSAGAAAQTSRLILNSSEKVKVGISLARETVETFGGIAERIHSIDASVVQLRGTSEAQTAAVAGITADIGRISEVIRSNSAAAEESAAASGTLSVQAARLREEIGWFSLRGEDAAAPAYLPGAAPGGSDSPEDRESGFPLAPEML